MITKTTMAAKHPLEQTAAMYPPSNRAAKHSPDDDQCNPGDVDEASEGRRRSRNSPKRADNHH